MAYSSVTLMNENMWVFGGMEATKSDVQYYNSLFVLSLVDDFEWSRALNVTKDVPSARVEGVICAGAHGNQVLMTGGTNDHSPVDTTMWSFYVLQ